MLSEENRLCIRALTAKQIAKLDTYNYRGFVARVEKKGDCYIVTNVLDDPLIAGSGDTVEGALASFRKAVNRHLLELAKDSQEKMLVRRFRRRELIMSRFRQYTAKPNPEKWQRP